MQRFTAAIAVALLAGCNLLHYNHERVLRHYEHAGLQPHQIELSSGMMRYYDDPGAAGDTIVFVHGFAFGALETWQKQVPAFAHEHRVIAPDLYWFGGSVPKTGAYDATAQADALAELLTKLSITKATIVGVSFGGFVALEWALRHPEQVGRLVLVDAAGLAPTEKEKALIEKTFGKHSIEELLIPADTHELRKLLGLLFYRHHCIPNFVLREILEQEMWVHREAKQRMCRDMEFGFLHPDQLATIQVPTLVMAGRYDPLILSSMTTRLANAIPHSGLVWFEHSRHSPMLEEPNRFNLELALFLLATKNS